MISDIHRYPHMAHIPLKWPCKKIRPHGPAEASAFVASGVKSAVFFSIKAVKLWFFVASLKAMSQIVAWPQRPLLFVLGIWLDLAGSGGNLRFRSCESNGEQSDQERHRRHAGLL